MPIYLRLGTGLAVVAALAVGFVGCKREDRGDTRARTEEAVLQHQIRGLQELVNAAESRTLTDADQIAVAINDKQVAGLIAASLPLERDVADRYRVRIEAAEVEFRVGRSLVSLSGRVSALGVPDIFADLRLAGGLDGVDIDSTTGLLSAKLVLDELVVGRTAASGAQSEALDKLVEDVTRERVESFADLAPDIQIPIKLDQVIAFKGFTEGPIAVGAGRLPINVTVARLMPLSGRLWILLTARAGPWARGDAS